MNNINDLEIRAERNSDQTVIFTEFFNFNSVN